ncbi:MAG: alpha/beta fold hydrolase, partial [Spirochaetes bacterium]|nr:alpha/beta fold hydrolase [Spirochaetota bacterium]
MRRTSMQISSSFDGDEFTVFSWPAQDAGTDESTTDGALPGGRGIVQYIHGMGDRAERNEALFAALAEASYTVYAADLRGHGSRTSLGAARTNGPTLLEPRKGLDAVVADCHDLRRELERRHPGAPIFLIGHSMGSLIARFVAADSPSSYRGVILSGVVGPVGPLLWVGRLLARIGRVVRGTGSANALLGAMVFGAYGRSIAERRTEFDWLSRDPEAVDAYIADPTLGGPFASHLYTDLFEAIDRAHAGETVAKIAEAGIPLYLLAGDADPVTENGASVPKVAGQLERAG